MTVPPIQNADAWLVDDRWSKAYALAGECHIGRGAGSSIILRDPVISRRHASVSKRGEDYVIESLGTAGTKVNGESVTTERVLREGDIIEIAFTTLRFTLMAPTGEMFVVARDTPTTIDQMEGPTRATVRAQVVKKGAFITRNPMLWFAIVVAIVLLVFFLTPSRAR